mgnify:CR=1 FL=1
MVQHSYFICVFLLAVKYSKQQPSESFFRVHWLSIIVRIIILLFVTLQFFPADFASEAVFFMNQNACYHELGL